MFQFLNLIFSTKRSLQQQLAEKEKIIESNNWLLRTWAHDQATAIDAISSAVDFYMEHGGQVTPDEMQLMHGGIQLLKEGSANVVDNYNGEKQVKNDFVDLLEMLTDVLHLHSAASKFKNISVSLQIEGTAPVHFYSDIILLKRILGNLISNSIKFSPPDEKIVLRCYGHQGFTFFEVSDHGPGIPANMQQLIFQPYIKLDHNRQGTGLGLAICKQFAKALGGDISVYSVIEKGSIFSVKIKAVNV